MYVTWLDPKKIAVAVALFVAALLLMPLWSGALFSTAPTNTDKLLVVDHALRCLVDESDSCEAEAVTLPDSWQDADTASRRVRYQLSLPVQVDREGLGLLIPSYRHHVIVRANGQLLVEKGSDRAAIPFLSMPALRVLLPMSTGKEPYKLTIEVSSNWAKQGGLGPVWFGDYLDLQGRQSMLIEHRKEILWLAAGTMLALLIYYAIYSAMEHGKLGQLLLSVPHLFLILICIPEQAPLESDTWLKLYITMLVFVVFSWGQQAFYVEQLPIGRVQWVALIPVLTLIPLWWRDMDLDGIWLWHTSYIHPAIFFMSTCYLLVWIRKTSKGKRDFRTQILVFSVAVLLFSAGLSDMLAIRATDGSSAVERELSFRYVVATIALMIFVSSAAWAAQKTKSLQARESQLNHLVDLRTADLVTTQLELRESEKIKTLYLLASGISHEIKNPLGAIQATVTMLRYMISADMTKQLKAPLDRIERSVARIDHIIGDLSINTQQTTARLLPLDLHAWLQSFFDDPQNARLLSEFSFTRDLHEVGQVRFDPESMHRVMSNLLQNSKRACASLESGQLHVELGLHDERVVLQVWDNGVGIESSIAGRVQGAPVNGKSMEMGLGLSFVYQIVEQHGGRFSLENRTDMTGAVATISLPRSSNLHRD